VIETIGASTASRAGNPGVIVALSAWSAIRSSGSHAVATPATSSPTPSNVPRSASPTLPSNESFTGSSR
jgi:hypothetical protein